MLGVQVGSQIKPPADATAAPEPPVPASAHVRVTLTPPDGTPLALYAEPPTTPGVVVLAHDYPDLPDVTGWAAKGRGFGGPVVGADGRTLTLEVTP